MDWKEYLKQAQAGEINGLEAYIASKVALKELEEVSKQLQPLAIDEAGKYGAKSFTAFGAKIELRNGASTWKFQGAAYDTAKANLKYIEELAKIGGGVIEATGEVVEKAIKIEGKQTIAISL